ncbi:MAG: LptF/LptG family permease, partial [Chitinivibrionia bacterium]|nr:LptF/LptG family permease [Chitinivibrionia bacterium]
RFEDIALYYACPLPYILTYITPVSLLLASIFSMGVLGRRNELTALISSGVSLLRISAPIIAIAAATSVGMIVFNETVVTKANRERFDIMHYDIEGRKRDDPMYKENLHYLGESGYVYLAGRYDHQSKVLFDVVLQKFDSNTLVRRIDAKMATWNDGRWIFSSGFDRTFAADSESVAAFRTLTVDDLQETPDDFAKEQIDVENMNFEELRAFIKKVRRSGGTVEQYLVDLYFKFSFPLAGVIFVLIGISFTSGKRRQSIATGFGATLIISFLYYGILRTGRTLGQNGLIPPLLASQVGNMLFLVVGAVLLRRANR